MTMYEYEYQHKIPPHAPIYVHDNMPIYTVLDPSKVVCVDPVERVAILEVKGPGPPVGVSESQLSPDRGGEKT
jgi:hypothetical protein